MPRSAVMSTELRSPPLFFKRRDKFLFRQGTTIKRRKTEPSALKRRGVSAGRSSIVAAMHFQVFVIGERIQQTQNMLAGARLEAVEQHGIGCALLVLQFQLRIIQDQVAVISNAQFRANLHDNLCARARCRHESTSPRWSPFARLSKWMRSHGKKTHRISS